MKFNSKKTGTQGEELAQQYLSKQGLTLIEKNFNCRLGEIDLIMQEGEYLVFIEVRIRHNQRFASPMESITYNKQQKSSKTAQFYLQQHHLIDKVPCRFDAVAVNLKSAQPSFEWIKNAF